uniref:Artemin n=1 Tax=Cairina moschata TaxID=8855 RepID=A0A8C3BWI8_CAIMO
MWGVWGPGCAGRGWEALWGAGGEDGTFGRGEVCQLPAGLMASPVCHWCLGGQGWVLPAPVAGAHPVCAAWALTHTPVLAASMEQRAGPPEPRPAGPSTHPQPKRSPPGTSKAKKGTRKPSRGARGRNCHIRNLMVKVRDLGLGFNSDEIVLFKYCSGSCHRARSNYDLTLGSLLRQQLIVPGPQERILSHPCCRPTRYEAVSFMDVQNTWQTVEKLSAAECSCIG